MFAKPYADCESTNIGIYPSKFVKRFGRPLLLLEHARWQWLGRSLIGREFRGPLAIKDWSTREIFDVQVTVEVINAAHRDGKTVLTAKVDGTFDRAGLPDPLIMEHELTIKGDKIVALTCRLAP